jgi:uncharacterized protein (DUF427 family)
MMKAIWNGKVIAESGQTVVVEGNHYFPRGSVNSAFLKETMHIQFVPGRGRPVIMTSRWMAR